jgi:hypothetical protein
VAALITFSGGSDVLVAEEAEDVVQQLDRESSVFVRLTRKSGRDESATFDGRPVYVRTAQVACVTSAG